MRSRPSWPPSPTSHPAEERRSQGPAATWQARCSSGPAPASARQSRAVRDGRRNRPGQGGGHGLSRCGALGPASLPELPMVAHGSQKLFGRFDGYGSSPSCCWCRNGALRWWRRPTPSPTAPLQPGHRPLGTAGLAGADRPGPAAAALRPSAGPGAGRQLPERGHDAHHQHRRARVDACGWDQAGDPRGGRPRSCLRVTRRPVWACWAVMTSSTSSPAAVRACAASSPATKAARWWVSTSPARSLPGFRRPRREPRTSSGCQEVRP